MKEEKNYNVKVKANLAKVIDKYVDDKHDDFPGFKAGEFFRLAAVKYLKHKGYLEANKRYL